jgi:hypothetical protein
LWRSTERPSRGARGTVVPFSLSKLSLKAGDEVDFAVGRGVDGSYADDCTLLNTTITQS